MSNNIYLGVAYLSKIIENKDYDQLTINNVTEDLFLTSAEKQVLEFVNNTDHKDITPELVEHSFPEFDFKYEVVESYDYLIENLMAKKAQRAVYNLLQNEASSKFESTNGIDFIEYLQEELVRIKTTSTLAKNVGTSIKDSDSFLKEYLNRKAGISSKLWASAFPSLPAYISGNMYTFFGRSGRGKSIITTVAETLAFAKAGATVLIWSLELSTYEVLSRLHSHISAMERMANNESNNDNILKGFEISRITKGEFDEAEEKDFTEFIQTLNSKLEGDIIVKGVDDKDFVDRSCKGLEKDILEVKPDVVIIDPPYLMQLENNKDRTTGGAMSQTSQKLRQLCGQYDIVLIVITQADDDKSEDDDGKRVLSIPNRTEIRKTKSFIDDASYVYGIDTVDNMFGLRIEKGRNGGEGIFVEGIFMPNIGVVYEPSISQIAKEAEALGFV